MVEVLECLGIFWLGPLAPASTIQILTLLQNHSLSFAHLISFEVLSLSFLWAFLFLDYHKTIYTHMTLYFLLTVLPRGVEVLVWLQLR